MMVIFENQNAKILHSFLVWSIFLNNKAHIFWKSENEKKSGFKVVCWGNATAWRRGVKVPNTKRIKNFQRPLRRNIRYFTITVVLLSLFRSMKQQNLFKLLPTNLPWFSTDRQKQVVRNLFFKISHNEKVHHPIWFFKFRSM